ncbi:hypothetical protein BCF58_1894 [Chryseobacterium defluvii]|uniref:Uncharacterized protein n=1 Tax=Chryseobacterium defluvii TaxID=160396 RepID=A0A495SE23_9FLAO|nr:hypothetical protein BCF58_1894 [Chryseobacterium defluvii]
MVSLSKILFFTSHHGIYTVLILFFIFGLLAFVTKKSWFLILILPLTRK